MNCPNCKKHKLSEAVNTYGDVVVQRVVGCDRCGHVVSFNAHENWDEVFKAMDAYKKVQHLKTPAIESWKEYEEITGNI